MLGERGYGGEGIGKPLGSAHGYGLREVELASMEKAFALWVSAQYGVLPWHR